MIESGIHTNPTGSSLASRADQRSAIPSIHPPAPIQVTLSVHAPLTLALEILNLGYITPPSATPLLPHQKRPKHSPGSIHKGFTFFQSVE
jgi:hypothetical protein